MNNMTLSRNTMLQFVKYACVGVLNTLGHSMRDICMQGVAGSQSACVKRHRLCVWRDKFLPVEQELGVQDFRSLLP